jgi:hypothetical protein
MREAAFHVNRRTALQMAALALPFVLVNVWDIVATLHVLLHTATSAKDTSDDAIIILMGTALVVAAGLSLLVPLVVLLLDWRRPPHDTTGRRLPNDGPRRHRLFTPLSDQSSGWACWSTMESFGSLWGDRKT